MTDDDAQFFRRVLDEIQVVPGAETGGAQYHVCSDLPQRALGANQVGACGYCGRTVFYSDVRPGLVKLCYRCTRALTAGQDKVEYVASEQTLRKVAEALALKPK